MDTEVMTAKPSGECAHAPDVAPQPPPAPASSPIGQPATMIHKMGSAQREALQVEVRRGFGQTTVLSKSHATVNDFVARTARMFVDLHAMGFQGITAAGLRPVHVEGLLQLWRNGAKDSTGRLVRKPLSRNSFANEWRALTRWARATGKRGMIPDLEEVWPKDDDLGVGGIRTGAGAGPRNQRRKTELVKGMTDAEYGKLLQMWANVRNKQTHYWLVRAIHELGLTRDQAYMLEPYAASIRQKGSLFVKTAKRRDAEVAIKIDTQEKVALVQDLIQYVDNVGRKRLGWNPKQVPTLLQADRKLKDAVTYALNCIRSGDRSPSVEDSERGSDA